MSWRLQFFTPQKSSGPGYIKDGLVLWLDGIWNAGVGIHDPNATEWVDLAGGGHSATITGCSIDTDGVRFNGVTSYAEIPDPNLAVRWIEVAYTGDYDNRILVFYPPGDSCIGAAGKNTIVATEARNATFPVLQGGRAVSVERKYTGRNYLAYRDGQAVTTYGGTDYFIHDPFSSLMIGAYRKGGQIARVYDGVIHSVRIYNRALSPEEIAANYAVDRERFGL